jgi:hypothetical protein
MRRTLETHSGMLYLDPGDLWGAPHNGIDLLIEIKKIGMEMLCNSLNYKRAYPAKLELKTV